MLDIEVQKSWYNKTKTEDGITHIVDDKQYTNYIVNINKIYFIENEIEFLKELKKDLLELTNEVERVIKK